ncbi:MAG: hypothetical protein R3B81_05225 [bacterium]
MFRDRRVRSRATTLAAFVVLLGGCGTTTPNLTLVGGPAPDRTFTVYIPEEQDLTGAYRDRLAFYELAPLGESLSSALARDRFKILWKRSYQSTISSLVVQNFLVVTDDSLAADADLVVGVHTLDFGTKAKVVDQLAPFWAVAPFGVPFLTLNDEPQGIVGASCRFEPRRAGELRAMDFEIVGTSETGLPRGDALAEAIHNAGDSLLLELFRSDRVSPKSIKVWVEDD